MTIKLDINKKYLLACSFGTDSMVLLDMLYKGGYCFGVAHVNYGLREEADSETTQLIHYCEERNIQLYIHRVGAFFPKGNVEAECRYIRYNFFKKIYDQESFDTLLVAHQQDDHIETYLLQITRDNCPHYYGLPYKRELYGMNVVRPLLSVSKNAINRYLEKHKIPHSIDKTNLEDNFERNKIRHQIIEKLNKEERLKMLQEIENKNNELTEKLAKLRHLNLNSVKTLLSLSDEDFILAFFILIEHIPFTEGISKRSILSFKDNLKSEKPNLTMSYNRVFEIIKAYDEIIVRMVDHEIPVKPFKFVLNEPGVLDTPYFYLNTLVDPETRNIHPEDYPITIRNAVPSDEFKIKDYKVKMRRAVIDWKMPSFLRNRWPIILNKNNEIIYVPRYQNKFIVTKGLNFYVKK